MPLRLICAECGLALVQFISQFSWPFFYGLWLFNGNLENKKHEMIYIYCGLASQTTT